MDGSGLGSFTRLWPSPHLGLQITWGGKTQVKGISLLHLGISTGCSDVLVTWKLASSRENNTSAQSRSFGIVYDLASEVKYHPSHHAYCSHRLALIHLGGDYTGA